MGPAGYGSASGAIKELERIGAIEGVHYRMSTAGERLTDFVFAVDNGPMVITMLGGFEVLETAELTSFAILNPDGMELVGAGISAAQMRAGKIPAEAVYVLSAD